MKKGEKILCAGMTRTPVVLLTGFGPFGEFQTNASWEVAKAVSELGIEEELGIKLVIKEVEVSYDTVSSLVPALWDEFEPTLVVHLGVSGAATKLTIESCAHKKGYRKCDVQGKLPHEGVCSYGTCEKVIQELDLCAIVSIVNSSTPNVEVEISDNAGRYLCEFIYYTSLCRCNKSTLFVHVPDIGKPYSVKEMAGGIKLIIASALEQIQKKEVHYNCIEIEVEGNSI